MKAEPEITLSHKRLERLWVDISLVFTVFVSYSSTPLIFILIVVLQHVVESSSTK